METTNYGQEFNSPPKYSSHGSDQHKDEMEFRNNPSQQVTVVSMPEEPPVRDHIIWSIFNAIYMNVCCLGVLALVFSVKSRDRKFMGDKNGARSYSSTARSLNIAATTLTILACVITIIILIVQAVMAAQVLKHSFVHDFGNGK
ncbi:interferon-induced transmembrane protein 2-like [Gastrophryne carolinensis]